MQKIVRARARTRARACVCVCVCVCVHELAEFKHKPPSTMQKLTYIYIYILF